MRCGDGDRKRAVKAAELCECIGVMEQRMVSDQSKSFLRYEKNFCRTIWACESFGEAVMTLKIEKPSCSELTTAQETVAG